MIVISVILAVLLLVAVAIVVLLVRRLLQFDESFQAIFTMLAQYQIDLKKLASGDILLDNPEVLEFQQRNLKALRDLELTVESMKEFATRPQELGPRPDVE